MGKVRVGIDTGGTFTDLVAFEPQTGNLFFHKVSSTPEDPSRGIIQGILEILERMGIPMSSIELLIHGTTVATNAVLQRTGAKVAFITTEGFRDVLQIQRQDRPHLYDLRSRRTPPLVPRARRFELRERTRFDGSQQTPVDNTQLDRLIDLLKPQGINAVAVGLLHSYAHPAHELEVGRRISKRWPEVSVCLSHELVGECGEYERFSTCAMNAFVQPVIQQYLMRLEQGLKKEGLSAPFFIMKSSGGVMSANVASRRSVETLMSGPAGGIVAGTATAQMGFTHSSFSSSSSSKSHSSSSSNFPSSSSSKSHSSSSSNSSGHSMAFPYRHLITADMGGTSFDVGLIQDGSVPFTRETEIGGLAVSVPMLDIHSVGAGGGSIGWIDKGGALRVGPQSAGARPGPAAYGLGGQEPTVTDANLVLGRLGTRSLLGGNLKVDGEAARRVIYDRLARPLGMSIEEAAEGMIRVVNTAMTAAIRKLTVERGHDPRHFVLCPFGGAGPLHGAELATELGMSQVLIPLAPGVNSAVGLLMTHLREDRVSTFVKRLEETKASELEELFTKLEDSARKGLQGLGGKTKDFRVMRSLGQRYLGQRYELSIPLEPGTLNLKNLAQTFHEEHKRVYGYAREGYPVEINSAWVSAEINSHPLWWPKASTVKTGYIGGSPEPQGVRQVYFAGHSYETPIFSRDTLTTEVQLVGPAIVEQLDATTVLWPKQSLSVDPYGQMVLGPMEVSP